MSVSYSFSDVCNAQYSCEEKVTHTGSIGKNVVFSAFLGVTLLTNTFMDLPKDTNFIRDFSPFANIECANIDGSKEFGYLGDSGFLDLLKFENINKLQCMSSFQEDWNGVGGLAFSESSINLFKEIIENLCKQPNIAPTGRGSLLMQYELDDNSILAFEVREEKVEMVCVPKGDYSSARIEVFTNDFIGQINIQVAHFYGLK